MPITAVPVAVLAVCATSTMTVHAQGATETEFSFSFENDAGGWTAGFADLPVGFDQSIYELDSGYRQLPECLDGGGVYVQGHNRRDDLFMFLKKRVEGLRADTTYVVTISLDLATNVPAGSFGIGGSPGESVYVKAEASTAEPLIVEDNAAWLRMNIHKGNQATEGESMIVLGNVATPKWQAKSTGSRPWTTRIGP
jgi:hypothetical protein